MYNTKEIFSFNIGDKKGDFSVVTYNVGSFNLDRYSIYTDKDTIITLDTTDVFQQNLWIDSLKADVVCFQEFYNNDMITSESIIHKMSSLGYHYFYMNPIKMPWFTGYFGIITFSKHPIIKSGPLRFSHRHGLNNGIYSDILIGKDTLRILNIHLHSMSLSVNFTQGKGDTLIRNIKVIKRKLEKGFIIRGRQIDDIADFVQKSPYPTIVAGDFNDTPYSYTYQKLKSIMKNTFENSGNGFGYTYNKFPWFIRIDNQFYTNGLQANYCEVMCTNKLSDHYPVTSYYSISK
ncbi:MAG: endonuclease/exonuclease/phosphatase family protein [Cytophagales bacterium]|nr:endonuclease/exonuclease/phosphatase family protein [Cytophagales bacterium]